MARDDKQKYRSLPRIRAEFSPNLERAFNSLASETEKIRNAKEIRVGKGLLIDDDEYTTTIRMGANASPPERFYPFKLFKHGGGGDDRLKIRVFYGTIAGHVPKIDVGGTKIAINDDSDSDIGLPYVQAGTGEGEYTIYIEFTPNDPCTTGTDEAVETPPEIKITDTPKTAGDNDNGVPADTNALGHVEIGRVTVEKINDVSIITKIHQSVTHSLMHRSCGVSHFFWGV